MPISTYYVDDVINDGQVTTPVIRGKGDDEAYPKKISSPAKGLLY